MIKVLFSTTDYLDDDYLYEKEFAEVSAYRKKRIEETKSKEDKKRMLAAEGLLKRGLQEAGINYSGNIVVNEHGKPYLKDEPGIFFSISHSGNRVLCVVADSEVGCDVEKSGRCRERIASRYFSEGECLQITAVEDGESKELLLTKIWCLKESYGKMTGLGLSGSLGRTDFDLSSDSIEGRCDIPADCRVWENDGYVYAYCIKE